MSDAAFRSQCGHCERGLPRGRLTVLGGRVGHTINGRADICGNVDAELRSIGEPFGFYTFAWLPKTCRNGKRRWLCWVERHDDGTYTLGNRAH